MARIYKRPGSKYWWLQWHEGGRLRRKSLKTVSHAVAKRELAVKEMELAEPHRHFVEPRNPTLKDFWKAHKEAAIKDGLRKNTLDILEYHWNMLKDSVEVERLGGIRKADVEALRDQRIAAGKSEQSINNMLKDLRRIFRWAIKQGYYPGPEPTQGIPRFKLESRHPEYHSENELKTLLEEARKISRETEWVVLLGAWAGLRRKEIVSARWEWFSWDSKRPVIHVTAYNHDGYRFELKDKEDRSIPMARAIYDAMHPHRKERGFVFVSDVWNTGKNRYRYEPMRGLRAALKKANLTEKDPYHRLRYTFASLHAQKGVSLYKIARWLGNSIEVCQRHYAHLQDYDEEIDGF